MICIVLGGSDKQKMTGSQEYSVITPQYSIFGEDILSLFRTVSRVTLETTYPGRSMNGSQLGNQNVVSFGSEEKSFGSQMSMEAAKCTTVYTQRWGQAWECP